MANQQNSYTGSQGTGTNNADFSFTFPSFTTSEVKVEVDNVVKTLTTHYTVENYNTTSGGKVRFTAGNIPTGTTPVRIFRQTDVDSAKATFTAGSSLKAGEINDNFKQVRHALQEAIGAAATDRKVQRFNIEADSIDGTLIADDVINSEHYVAGSIDHEHLANDIIDGDNIQDDVINSEHYVAGSIDLEHMSANSVDSDQYVDGSIDLVHMSANSVDSDQYVDGSIDEVHLSNSAITSNKIAANAVTTTEILNGAVTRAKLEADAIDGTKLADNAVDSEHYTDGSIDRVHLEADIIDSTKLADNAVNSEHYVDGSIDRVHLAADIVDGTKIADDSIDSEHIAAGALDNEHYAAGSITSDKLNGATVVTNSEQAASTPNDTSFFTTAAAEARYFNASTGETIKDGDSFPDNDTTIATTAAINDRIIDLVDDVGGFVPIANETSFPNANPDVNNGTGTIVSISTLASNHTSNGSGTFTISNGTVGNSTVTINGAANNTTYSAGYGLLVETTTTLNTYTFHRLVPKATEVTTVAGKATEIGRLGTADAVADMALLGTADVVSDLNTLGTADVVADMNMLAVSDVISDMNTLAVTSVVNNIDTVATNVANVNTTAGSISNVNTTAGSISNVNTVAGSISNVNTVGGSISNVNTTAGSISNVNSVASNMANVNNFADRYQIASNNPSTDGGGNALAAGDLYFNTSANELKVYNGSSWQGGVTATGNFAVTTGNTFTGDNRYNDSVKALFGTGSDLEILHDGTNSRLNSASHNLNVRTPRLGVFNGGGSETLLLATADGSVELYYDNSKKFETTSTGVAVTGQVTIPDGSATGNRLAIGDAQDLALYHNGSNSFIADRGTGPLYIRGNNAVRIESWTGDASGEPMVIASSDGAVELYYDNSLKLNTNAAGIRFYGSLRGIDNEKLELGSSQDLQIYHSGTESWIKEIGTGALYLASNAIVFNNAATDENMAKFLQNGAVELYYDNSKKFETWTSGARLPSDNNVLAIGAGDDLRFWHNATNSIIRNATGQLQIQSNDLRLGNYNFTETYLKALENGAVELYHNNSKKLETTSTGATITGKLLFDSSTEQTIKLADNRHIHFGDGADLKIYHDGGHSYIHQDGTGSLYILADTFRLNNEANTENIIAGNANGAAELYYDNSKKLETTSAGVTVTGALTTTFGATFGSGVTFTGNNYNAAWVRSADTFRWYDNAVLGFGDSDDLKIYHSGSHSFIKDSGAGNLQMWTNQLSLLNSGGAESMIQAAENGAVELYYDNSKKLETTSDGVTVSGAVKIYDGNKILCGHGNDLQIYHNGTDSVLDNITGELQIATDGIMRFQATEYKFNNAANSEKIANFFQNGACELYYDHSKKFETTSSGISVAGNAIATGNIQVNDNGHVYVGNSGDLDIYHDGTDSHIKNTNNSGRLKIRSHQTDIKNADNNETQAIFHENAAVELFYDNSKKFETTSNGVTMTGSQFIMSGAMGSTENFKISNTTSGAYIQIGLQQTDTDGLHHRAYIRAKKGGGSIAGRLELLARGQGGGTDRGFFIDAANYIESSLTIQPTANNSYNLGSSSKRWQNIYTNDLNLSNEGSSNDMDGTWGDWTIQEGESNLFLKNNRSGKKYKFNLTEVS